MAMDKLRELDQIAYIRFASVYQSFEELEQLSARSTRCTPRRATGACASVSVLSDRDIRAAMQAGRVRIDPYDPAASSRRRSTSISTLFRVFRNNRYPYIDCAPQPDLTELFSIEGDEPFILHPNEFVLGQTLEWVELPDDLVARLEGKSSLGRLGPADPLDGRLRGPGLEGQSDPRAVERGQPADCAVPRHEDRPDLVLQDVLRGRAAVRLARAGVQVPGPVVADRVSFLKDFAAKDKPGQGP